MVRPGVGAAGALNLWYGRVGVRLCEERYVGGFVGLWVGGNKRRCIAENGISLMSCYLLM